MQPTRVFDAHFHLIDPAFPLVENQGFLPDPFGIDAYRVAASPLPVRGGALVSGSFQGYDTSYLAALLPLLGPGFVGVANVPLDATADDIVALDRVGIRAARFNLFRGITTDLDRIERLARLTYETAGWHSEFYLDAAHLADLAPLLRRLPQITIDHFGMADDPSGTLLSLVARGAVVKATGLGRITVAEPAGLARRILAENPAGLMFATDLPSTRARVPYSHEHALRIAEWVGDEHVDDVFYANAARLYRMPEAAA